MMEEACQADIFTRPRWACEPTFETIPISVANQYPQLHSEVLTIFSMYIWESTGEKMLSTFLHNSWGRRRVKLIFLPDLAGDVN